MAASWREWRWAVVLCYSTSLGFLLSRHAFWRDEVQAWQVAVHTDSISSLFHSLRYEGHPALWFLFLRGLSVFFDSPEVMLGAHWLLASLNAFLLIWLCPIPPMAKDCLLFRLFHLVRVRSDLPKLRHRRIARFYLCSSS